MCSEPVVAQGETLAISPMAGYFAQQFEVNDSPDAMPFWQVHDRTANAEIPRENWRWENGRVVIEHCTPWHEYTVNFLADCGAV